MIHIIPNWHPALVQERVTNRINSIEQAASSVADALMVFGRNPGRSCVSATPQLKRE
jgi:hypothetical protein